MSRYYKAADGRGPRAWAATRPELFATRGSMKLRINSLRELLLLKGLPSDVLVVLAYIVLSRAFIGDEATLGIKVGPVPLFITDATLGLLFALAMCKRGGRLLNWFFSGAGAGEIGRAVWVLFLIAIVYFALAFPEYRIMAMHDLAIFGYCVFFPLTYFALSQRTQAAKLVRYLVYATCLGAAFFNFQTFSGVQLFALTQAGKGLPGHQAVAHLNANNLGADLGPALAGLFAYIAVERQHRALHAGALLLCLATLAQVMDRSAFLGFFLAAGLMFILGVGRARVYLTALAAGLFVLVLVTAQGELPIPGGTRLHNFWIIISSGANFQNDPDGQFRLQRWRKTAAVWIRSPVFGVGFGAPIMLDSSGENLRGEVGTAAQRGALGAFNVGMPHNSFLMVLARTGLIGLGLICFAWITGIRKAIKRLNGRLIDPDQLAVAGILIAMISTAALNLFFERPMLCAPFWMMLAASYKLSASAAVQIPWMCGRSSHAARFPFFNDVRVGSVQSRGMLQVDAGRTGGK
jgi:O-antigen ligase